MLNILEKKIIVLSGGRAALLRLPKGPHEGLGPGVL